MEELLIEPEVRSSEADHLEESIPSSRLNWPGASPEQLNFMRQVYDTNLQRTLASGKTFVADVPPAELATIEGNKQARRPVAQACQQLLAAVRAAIQEQGRAVRVEVVSAYRSASQQLALWERYFTEAGGYYRRTQEHRQQLPGGEHGSAAVNYMAQYVRGRIGTPGFSHHNDGRAVDFGLTENNRTYQNSTTTAATNAWRQSWFWSWMQLNANRFQFFQNQNINEPWHWEHRTSSQPGNAVLEQAAYVETGGGSFLRLREPQVQYLALEGGGGKGFVYVGAIRALEEKGILRFANGRLVPTGLIKGISGASAGAISALLLSIGYNAAAIEQLMRTNNFNNFFDLPQIPSRLPRLGDCRNGQINLGLRALEQFFQGFVRLFVPNLLNMRVRVSTLINDNLEQFFRQRISAADAQESAIGKLRKYPLHYVSDLISDMGVYSGCAAREFFDNLLRQKSGQRNLTFEQHYQEFRVKLVLTGTNLERGTSEYFSVRTTPRMPVADAVRISMGLPFIYKPYRITGAEAQTMGNAQLAGLWVDGGVRNNMPIRAFESEPGANPKTLGIRLGEDGFTPINNVVDLFTALTIRQGLMGSGEADISTTSGYRQQTVVLSTRGLSLTEFNPRPEQVRPLVEQAHTSINRYFNPALPTADTDHSIPEKLLAASEFLSTESSLDLPELSLETEATWQEQLTPAPPVQQQFLDTLTNLRLRNSADINAYFQQAKGSDFATWFNHNVGGREHWSARRLATDSQFPARFNALWNNIPLMFGSADINLVQFLVLMSIIINETGGRVAPITEGVGRTGHPGIAYAFDRIEGLKVSYNKSPNRTAFSLFNDPLYISTHGNLPLGNQLANTTDQVWAGQQYPQDRFSTSTQPSQTGFILEADFYKFRGRGFIQNTWRPAYMRLIDFCKTYSGPHPLINQYRQNWASLNAEQAATISTNADWDRLFQQTDLIIPCRAIYQHQQQAGNYLNLPLQSTQLNGTGLGSIYRVGLRVSGGTGYARLFKNRVLQIIQALAN